MRHRPTIFAALLAAALFLSAGFAPLPAGDGKRYRDPVIFQRAELDEATGKVKVAGKLWVMEADGSGLRQLTTGMTYDEHPSMYSGQQHVLYAEFPANGLKREAGAKLIKLNIYTGQREVIAEEEGCALHHASLSPFDDLIAYHKDCGERYSQWLGVGAAAHELPFRASNGVRTRDGIIVMHEKNRGQSPREVALVHVRGQGAGLSAEWLTGDKVLHRRAAVSPDGQSMAWQTNQEGGEDEIFLARIDGSQAKNLTKAQGNDGHPWFSRDGNWIVFESDRTGNWEIWRLHLESGKQEQLTDGGKRYVSTRARM